MIRVGVIGYGYWGPNIVRNFVKLRDCRLVAVADADNRKLKSVKLAYPFLETLRSAERLFDKSDVDAVAIATPISTHYRLTKRALEQGKHVLVEKPMTETVAQAEELIRLAKDRRKVLMVDHTFVWCGAVRKIRELIDSDILGKILYYDSVRVNLGLFQHDVNVLWDLGPHDFSVMTYLIDKKIVGVSAIGANPVQWEGWKPESVVYVTVRFADDTVAHFHLNWLSPIKVRRTMIGGSKKMIVYDHLDADNQVKIFDKGVNVQTDDKERCRALIQYRTGDMLAPKVDQTEALETVCRKFIDSIRLRKKPLDDSLCDLRIVKLLQAAQESIQKQGKMVLF